MGGDKEARLEEKLEEKKEESSAATTVAHDAALEVIKAQLEATLEKVINKQFSADDVENQGTKRFINVGRIPLICQSIVGIHNDIAKIENNLNWGVRLVLGAVILGVIALLFKQ